MKILYACLIALLLTNTAFGARINVAAQTNGGVASASSIHGSGLYQATAINNGDHKGISWGQGGGAGGWADDTPELYPDWAQITFNNQKTIDEIDVFTIQDNALSPIEPTATMTFSAYGLTAYDVQYWNGASWVTVPGGSISNNNLVWRKFNFPAITTDRIRVLVSAALSRYSRIIEVEAYSVNNIAPTVSLNVPLNTYYAPASINLTANANDSNGTVTRVEFYNGATLLSTATVAPYSYTWANVPAGNYTLTAKAYDNANASTTSSPVNVTVNTVGARINVAAKANGGVASASSIHGSGLYQATAINNGDHKGINWGQGGGAGGWADDTPELYPDWAQITFSNQKTIDEIDVFTIQDNALSPIEPTATMTFSAYGLTAYDVQYWNGASWVTVPGGSISNNNLVWRKFNFPAITTDRIRVLVSAALSRYSRIIEVEAYGVENNNVAPTVSITGPATNNSFTAPASISLTANASDSDGTVARVEFYNGATLLSATTAGPYGFTWTNVLAGSYTLTAKAYDNAGASTTSSPINVTVNPAVTTPVDVYYIYADHLNTPRVITNTANATVWKWDSDPFGTDVANQNPAGLGTFSYNLRFPGQYWDKETGLHYNYFRDYDPSTGRYIQSDPIGLSGGINTYAYAWGNPLSFSDPFGLLPSSCTATPQAAAMCGEAGAEAVAAQAPAARAIKEIVQNSEIIAKGRNIRKVEELCEKFGGKARDWTKKKGWDKNGNEWHWYENLGRKIGWKKAGEVDPF